MLKFAQGLLMIMNLLAKRTRSQIEGAFAFGRIELVVALAIGFMLALVAFPQMMKARSTAKRITCVCHLKQIGLSFRIWAGDAGTNRLFPQAISTNLGGTKEFVGFDEAYRHFQIMSNELSTTRVLVCPADARPAGSSFQSLTGSNLSYFVALDAEPGNPRLLLSGDRNLTDGTAAFRGLVSLAPNDSAHWNERMHKGVGNVALADGSVQQVSSARFAENIRGSGQTNRFLFP